MKAKITLPQEPMSYKEQIKISETSELLTKLKIIREVQQLGHPKTAVAEKYQMHRNTVRDIEKNFKQLPQDIQKKLLTESITKGEIKKIMAPLKNKSTKPHSNKRRANLKQEALILNIYHKRKIKVGHKRMYRLIKRKTTNIGTTPKQESQELKILSNLTYPQLKGIYKRHKLKVKKKRTCNGQRKALYDYESLACFERLHFDTKDIPDQKALPPDIYDKFKLNKNLPVIEWNIIDAKSRYRFIAYSHNRTSEFGLRFLLFVIQFLRAYNLASWDIKIIIGTDNGSEFFSGSERKKTEWNNFLKHLNAEIYSYEPGHDIRKNLIERSHRTDDEEFFVPRGSFINSKQDFLIEASTYSHYFNSERPHSGIGMNDLTPLEKIKKSGITNPNKLLDFPTMILEDYIDDLRHATEILFLADILSQNKYRLDNQKFIADAFSSFPFSFFKNAQNVLTYYQKNEHLDRKTIQLKINTGEKLTKVFKDIFKKDISQKYKIYTKPFLKF